MQYRKLSLSRADFDRLSTRLEPKAPTASDCLKAFLFGGGLCAFGELLAQLYTGTLVMTRAEAYGPAGATLIFLAGLLTSLGVFDRIAKHAGAGTAVPITGFANSMVSAALEFKKEGLVLGIGSKMFSLSGSVITFGVVTAFVAGLLWGVIH